MAPIEKQERCGDDMSKIACAVTGVVESILDEDRQVCVNVDKQYVKKGYFGFGAIVCATDEVSSNLKVGDRVAVAIVKVVP